MASHRSCWTTLTKICFMSEINVQFTVVLECFDSNLRYVAIGLHEMCLPWWTCLDRHFCCYCEHLSWLYGNPANWINSPHSRSSSNTGGLNCKDNTEKITDGHDTVISSNKKTILGKISIIKLTEKGTELWIFSFFLNAFLASCFSSREFQTHSIIEENILRSW